MIRLNPLYKDGAVLQANKPLVIEGYAKGLEQIHACLSGKMLTVRCDKDGLFTLCFPALPVSLSETLFIEGEGSQLSISVRLGHVFLFAGQSNMEFKMKQEAHFEEERAAFTESSVYYYNVPQIEYEDCEETIPSDLEEGSWKSLDCENLGELSAVAYYAVKEYQSHFPQTPVGIVSCCKGGTIACCWISEEYARKSPAAMSVIVNPYAAQMSAKSREVTEQERLAYIDTSVKYYALREKWAREHPEMSLGEIKANIGGTPWPPPASPKSFRRPFGLYRTMFRKIVPYTFQEAVWYQGEDDTYHAEIYRELLPLIVGQWREDLKDSYLPFTIVQLHFFDDKPEKLWPVLRQAQQAVIRKLPNLRLVTTFDNGLPDNIHYPDKSLVGKRTGEILARKYYSCCPMAVLEEVDENHIVLNTEHCLELRLSGEKAESALETGGIPYRIEIEGSRLCLVFEKGTLPKRISYGWSNAPKAVLFNEVGYPVSPFQFEI